MKLNRKFLFHLEYSYIRENLSVIIIMFKPCRDNLNQSYHTHYTYIIWYSEYVNKYVCNNLQCYDYAQAKKFNDNIEHRLHR